MIVDDDGVIVDGFGNGRLYAHKVKQWNSPDFDVMAESDATGLHCEDPTMTQQQFAEEVDINTIVKNFGVTGMVPTPARMPMQGDFTHVKSYQEALNQIMEADAAFAGLDADVRKRFDNDPGQFVEYASNPANHEELKKLGLTRPEQVKGGPIEVRVVPEPPSEG